MEDLSVDAMQFDNILPTVEFFFSKLESILSNPDAALLTAAAAKSLQSCPTLCDPIDGSPPGFIN